MKIIHSVLRHFRWLLLFARPIIIAALVIYGLPPIIRAVAHGGVSVIKELNRGNNAVEPVRSPRKRTNKRTKASVNEAVDGVRGVGETNTVTRLGVDAAR